MNCSGANVLYVHRLENLGHRNTLYDKGSYIHILLNGTQVNNRFSVPPQYRNHSSESLH